MAFCYILNFTDHCVGPDVPYLPNNAENNVEDKEPPPHRRQQEWGIPNRHSLSYLRNNKANPSPPHLASEILVFKKILRATQSFCL